MDNFRILFVDNKDKFVRRGNLRVIETIEESYNPFFGLTFLLWSLSIFWYKR